MLAPRFGLVAAALLVGAALCAAPAAGFGTGPQSTAPAASYLKSAHQAARWQAGQLDHGRMPGSQPGSPDWGLTVDTALMLAADGGQQAKLAQVQRALSKHVLDYISYQDHVYSGAASKLLLSATTMGADPKHFGGHNLRKIVVGLIAPKSAGSEAGRLRDSGTPDYSNMFTQAYGAIALAKTGKIPQPVVTYLVKQRCSAGYFHLYETAGKTCDQVGDAPDVDATALAIQALTAAKSDGAKVDQGVIDSSAAWLASVQLPDGSYSEDATGSAPESNSTGLAAAALTLTGHAKQAKLAAAWVASIQITKGAAGSGPAKKDIGAIAFTAAAYQDGIEHGLGSHRPQWWRSTPQAYFALNPVPFASSSTAGSGAAAAAEPAGSGTSGYCKSDNGVTVVVDFQELGGGIVVRCAPGPLGSDYTGLDALQDAGFSPEGTARWGLSLICRIAGKPSEDQTLSIPGDPDYHEQCLDTPPQSAFWGYWYAPNGGSWTFSQSGPTERDVIEGGFEGWSFSLDHPAGQAPPPGIAPQRPQKPPHSPPPTTPPTHRPTHPPTHRPTHGPTHAPTHAPTTQPSTGGQATGAMTSGPTTSALETGEPSTPSASTSGAGESKGRRTAESAQTESPATVDPVAAGQNSTGVKVRGALPGSGTGSGSTGGPGAATVVGIVVLAALAAGGGVVAWRRRTGSG